METYVELPEGLIREATGFANTGHGLVMRPTFGSVGSQYVQFKQVLEYCGKESEQTGKEVMKAVEICEITNDRFTRCPVRINDLTPQQRIELGPLYERFKEQKDSTETDLMTWEAASHFEKALLVNAGFLTVEQIERVADDELYKLGPEGKDMRERARRHVAGKNEREGGGAAEELRLVMEENAKLQAKLKEAEERYYQEQAAKAAAEKKPSPKKEKGNA